MKQIVNQTNNSKEIKNKTISIRGEFSRHINILDVVDVINNRAYFGSNIDKINASILTETKEEFEKNKNPYDLELNLYRYNTSCPKKYMIIKNINKNEKEALEIGNTYDDLFNNHHYNCSHYKSQPQENIPTENSCILGDVFHISLSDFKIIEDGSCVVGDAFQMGSPDFNME